VPIQHAESEGRTRWIAVCVQAIRRAAVVTCCQISLRRSIYANHNEDRKRRFKTKSVPNPKSLNNLMEIGQMEYIRMEFLLHQWGYKENVQMMPVKP